MVDKRVMYKPPLGVTAGSQHTGSEKQPPERSDAKIGGTRCSGGATGARGPPQLTTAISYLHQI